MEDGPTFRSGPSFARVWYIQQDLETNLSRSSKSVATTSWTASTSVKITQTHHHAVSSAFSIFFH